MRVTASSEHWLGLGAKAMAKAPANEHCGLENPVAPPVSAGKCISLIQNRWRTASL